MEPLLAGALIGGLVYLVMRDQLQRMEAKLRSAGDNTVLQLRLDGAEIARDHLRELNEASKLRIEVLEEKIEHLEAELEALRD